MHMHDEDRCCTESGHTHEHTHEHTHCHTHEHTHSDGTAHTHEHGHTEGASTSEQTIALLGYMLGHNRDHAEELHEMAHRLKAEGHAEEAELLHAGVAKLNEGNDRLAEALAKLKGEDK